MTRHVSTHGSTLGSGASQRRSDPWLQHVQISRQVTVPFYECLPHQLMNGARIHVRKADRCYAQATHQKKAEKKTKWHARALWHLCHAGFLHLLAEVMIELEVPYPKALTHRQVELCWLEAMQRASLAARAAGQ